MSEFLPGLEGVPATKSAISFIDGEKGILSYRGYSLETLAANSTFEETTLLLLEGELPTGKALNEFLQQLRSSYRIKYHIREMMRHFPATGHPMDMLQTAVSSLGMFYPGNECLTDADSQTKRDEYVRNMTVNIIAQMAPLVAMWEHMRQGYDPIEPRDDLSVAENLLYMFTGQEPDTLMARIMDVCLILHAEHTLNASTFAALVAGSTLATPYSVISAAIGTLSGPLHGGANQKVVGMLQDIGSPDKVEAWVDKKLANKEVIWGMGHREYKVKDPRATILHRLVEKLVEERGGQLDQMFATAMKLEQVCADRLGHKGVYPNVDFYSGILYSEMGIAEDQFTALFAVARSAGWLAHWREQISDNRIYRPTQIYVGHQNCEYVPINKRG